VSAARLNHRVRRRQVGDDPVHRPPQRLASFRDSSVVCRPVIGTPTTEVARGEHLCRPVGESMVTRFMPDSSEPLRLGVHQRRFEPPPGATEILFVRHGEFGAGRRRRPFGLVDGQGDPSLSPHGRTQAARGVCPTGPRKRRRRVRHHLAGARCRAPSPWPGPSQSRGRSRRGLPGSVPGDWEGDLFRKMVAIGPGDAAHVRGTALGRDPGANRLTCSAAGTLGRGGANVPVAHPGQRVSPSPRRTSREILLKGRGPEPFAFAGSDNASISSPGDHPSRNGWWPIHDTAISTGCTSGPELHQ